MSRHGTTLNDKQVTALLRMFELIDRGSDPTIIVRSEHVRRFRATLLRFKESSLFGERSK